MGEEEECAAGAEGRQGVAGSVKEGNVEEEDEEDEEEEVETEDEDGVAEVAEEGFKKGNDKYEGTRDCAGDGKVVSGCPHKFANARDGRGGRGGGGGGGLRI